MSAPLRIADEVRAALADRWPVVALETSVLAQGLPRPGNAETAAGMDAVVRASGAVPAWIALDAGELVVGAGKALLERLCVEPAAKVARRDVSASLASGELGATTVSAMVWAAARARIPVAATGGIGGVHPGSGDVSADLAELARTPVLLVCSGPKSIVDPVATAERLEELGVAVVGYRCERLPFFLAEAAPVGLEHRVDEAAEAARILRHHLDAELHGAVLLCNPVPAGYAMDAAEVAAAVRRCEERAARDGVTGKDLTPFLLSCLAEQTGGASLEANVALLESNARLAAEVAAALATAARSS